MIARRKVAVALTFALATAALGVGCSGDDGAAPARVRSPDPRLTDAEWDYGASVDRDTEGVVFQPDVVIPGGGAESVVQVSGDGLTWTLDGDAAEVADLAPGKLLFVTNRGAGRVLGVEQAGEDVAVTIGPAALTDFFVELDASYDGAIDPALVQVRAAPTRPSSADVTNRSGDEGDGTETDDPDASGGAGEPDDPTSPPTTGDPGPVSQPGPDPQPGPAPGEESPTGTGASIRSAGAAGNRVPDLVDLASATAEPVPPVPSLPIPDPASRGVLPPVAQAPLPVVPVTGMRAFPLHGSDGSWGVELAYDHNGLKVVGSARVYLHSPTIHFDLVIADAKIVTAEARIDGVAGVRGSFDAATETGLQANIHQVVDLPLDISMPILGPALPFAVNFHQSFKIDTVFSAKQSTLSFTGDYAFQGSLRVGYSNGSFGVGAPTGLSVKRSLLESTNGVSLGVNGFLIAHKLRMTIGIGGWGFAVGPYVSLTTTMSVVRGSDLGMVTCKGANLVLDLGYGIGYVMPLAVATLVNVFLRALNLREIEPTGGTEPQTTRLATLQGTAPAAKVCEGAV